MWLLAWLSVVILKAFGIRLSLLLCRMPTYLAFNESPPTPYPSLAAVHLPMRPWGGSHCHIALLLFWPPSREPSLHENSPLFHSAEPSPSPPCLPFLLWWVAARPLLNYDLRPAASVAFYFACTGLLVFKLDFLLDYSSTLWESHACLLDATFSSVFHLSPHFYSCFLGSFLKAGLILFWRFFFTRHYSLIDVHLSNSCPRRPTCCLVPAILSYGFEPSGLANRRPLRCLKSIFIFLSVFLNLHTYYNEQSFPPSPLGLLASRRGGLRSFYLHGPGVCHVRWVPPPPSYEGFLCFLCHWRSGIFCTADARARAAL